MERRDIEIFLTLAQELHFGRTAEKLHVTTARVSQTIKQLERRIGVPLFERTSRKVSLTPIGRALLDDIGPGYEQIKLGFERAVAAGRDVEGDLNVGFFRAAAGQFVLEVADAFRLLYPATEVHIRENQVGDGLDQLRTGKIDMLLLMLPLDEPDLATGPVVVREERLLAVSARHPFARRPTVALNDLARDKVLRAPGVLPDYLRDSVVPEQTPDGRAVQRGPQFATIQEMLSLVGAGKGMYPVPAHTARYYARPQVAFIPFADAEPFEWAFTWLANGATARIRAFDAAALEVAKSRLRTRSEVGFAE
jgi:DNA-binding transcriptional LysR family regulator